MQSVAETSIFTRLADALLNREDRAALITMLAQNPQAGDLRPGLPVLALLICAKNEQDNISADQRRALLAIIGQHKAEMRAKKKGQAG